MPKRGRGPLQLHNVTLAGRTVARQSLPNSRMRELSWPRPGFGEARRVYSHRKAQPAAMKNWREPPLGSGGHRELRATLWPSTQFHKYGNLFGLGVRGEHWGVGSQNRAGSLASNIVSESAIQERLRTDGVSTACRVTRIAGPTELKTRLVVGENSPDIGLDVVFVHQSRPISRCHPAPPIYEECVGQVRDSVLLRGRIVPK